MFIVEWVKGTRGQIPRGFLVAPLNTDAGLFALDNRWAQKKVA